MSVQTVERRQATCERCGHQWVLLINDDELPATCPKNTCRSPYWNRPRKNVRKEEIDHIREGMLE